MSSNIVKEIYSTIFKIVPENIKKQLLLCQFVILLNSILQIIISLLFIPYISLIVNKDEIIKYLPLIYRNHIETISQGFFIFEITVLFFLLIIIGLIVSILNDYYIYKISGKIKTYIQKNLFVTFLKKNYLYFTKISSSEISKVINEESNKIDQITFASLNFISNFLLLFVFIVFFFIKSFYFSVIMLLFSVLVFLFNKIYITNRVKSLGGIIGTFFEKRTKLLNESIEGIKEVKVNRLEYKTTKNFEFYTEKYNGTYVNYNILLNIPKYLVIFILYSSIALLLVISVLYNSDKNFILDIAFLGVSALRIVPSLQAIISSIVSINFHKEVIKLLKSEKIDYKFAFEKQHHNNIVDKITTNSIVVNNLTFEYIAGKIVLGNINFEIKENSFVGIAGSSGAGKTTLVNILLGLLNPTSGNVYVNGIDLNLESYDSLKSFLAYVPQQTFLFDDTIANNICLNEKVDITRLKQSLEIACCDFVVSDEYLFNEFVGERGVKLSGGQRQRIGIARAIYSTSPIIFFDESTSALDDFTCNKIIENLKNISHKRLIFFITHKESNLEMMNKILYINKRQTLMFDSYQSYSKFLN